ncbi:MAG TPA: GNAT family N-acetyltransferase [Plantibacter sp.]|uniref:GNAT family N-acetyltransferase n=1 Tax=unclassified Plantibacter TaxID=2624265 RepID=UPI002BBAB968|nr:GNAT family N-acetyltransferase [Plantibacter sp.]
MDPFSLHTERLVLGQPTASDIDDIAGYCTEPEFERFMTTPWPYEREDARFFVDEHVPRGWSSGTEWTWSIREADGENVLGVVGVRMNSGMVGYWLGRPHRGRGIMPEALEAVIDAVFERSDWSEVRWECVVGNTASMRVAEKLGFRFTGAALGIVPGRDGALVESWTGRLGRDDDRSAQPGWPD